MKTKAFGVFFAFVMAATAAFAQMGGGMKEGQKSGMHQGQMMQHGGMMDHGQMMGGMRGMSNQMSEMMGKISGMMKDMPASNMKMMCGVMNDMSHQMMEMSMAMGSGKVSEEAMKKMQGRMMEIQKRISGMEMHK
jgi:hypothetical protein